MVAAARVAVVASGDLCAFVPVVLLGAAVLAVELLLDVVVLVALMVVVLFLVDI